MCDTDTKEGGSERVDCPICDARTPACVCVCVCVRVPVSVLSLLYAAGCRSGSRARHKCRHSTPRASFLLFRPTKKGKKNRPKEQRRRRRRKHNTISLRLLLVKTPNRPTQVPLFPLYQCVLSVCPTVRDRNGTFNREINTDIFTYHKSTLSPLSL